MTLHTCLLPGGYLDTEGVTHREVVISPLTGREEEVLARANEVSSAILVTSILSNCIKRIGTLTDITEEVTRTLSVGDRQFLMLKLRELTYGERVEVTLSCPWPDCGERVDIDFRISDIPVKQGKQSSFSHKMKLSTEAISDLGWEKENGDVYFRIPNGSDQEILAPLLLENEAEALTQLLWRCLFKLGEHNEPTKSQVQDLTPLARMEIEKEMEVVSPAMELNMDAVCPECGRKFTAPFDLQEFFFGEFRTSQELLYREIHYLAYHYHWSESEIMNFPREKRRQYIDVLSEEIERLNNAIA